MPPARMLVALSLLVASTLAFAQTVTDQSGQLPNPYSTTDRWGTLPAGRVWGGISAIEVDRDGRSIWVGERCGAQSCAGSPHAPILKLDPSGAVVASFGAGMFVAPHGMHVDREGNIWVTDASDGVNKVPD